MDVARMEFANRLLAIAGTPDLWAELEPIADSASAGGAGDGTPVFACGLGGHGLASRTFELVIRCETLDFQFALSALRLLSDESSQREDEENARLACKLAASALALAPGALPGRLVARSVPGGPCEWLIVGATGEILREGEGWGGLTDQLAAGLRGSDRGMQIIGA